MVLTSLKLYIKIPIEKTIGDLLGSSALKGSRCCAHKFDTTPQALN